MNTRSRLIILVVLITAAFFAAGCARQSEPTQQKIEPPIETQAPLVTSGKTGVETQISEDVEEPEAKETGEAEIESEEPVETSEEESDGIESAGVSSEDACIQCHTDQQSLIDTAEAIEEIESENEGAG